MVFLMGFVTVEVVGLNMDCDTEFSKKQRTMYGDIIGGRGGGGFNASVTIFHYLLESVILSLFN